MSEHGHLQELVAKSLDAGLDNSERSTLGQHLPVCSECRHLQDELRRNDELIGVSDRDILVRPLTTARRTERVSNLSQLFVAVGVAAVFAVALLVGDFLRSWRTSVSVANQASSSPSAATSCNPPPSPRYLPFTVKPAPVIQYDSGGVGARYEAASASSASAEYAFVGNQPSAPDWVGQGTTARVNSRTVHMIWLGDPGVGEITAYWESGNATCSYSVASLVLRRGSAKDIEDELLRVIASLP